MNISKSGQLAGAALAIAALSLSARSGLRQLGLPPPAAAVPRRRHRSARPPCRGVQEGERPADLQQRAVEPDAGSSPGVQKKYPWIKVTATDDEDPVVFSKYAAEHATGTRTADLLIASAPGLWVAAVAERLDPALHAAGHRGLPRLRSPGQRTVHLLARPGDHDLQQARAQGAAGADDGRADRPGRRSPASTRWRPTTIGNNFGYTAFYGYVHQKGWAALEQLGKTAKTPGDGDVLGQDVAQGGYAVAVFESGLVARPDRDHQRGQAHGLGVHQGLHAADPARYRHHRRRGQPRLGQAVPELRLLQRRPAGAVRRRVRGHQQHVHARRRLRQHPEGAVRGGAARPTST